MIWINIQFTLKSFNGELYDIDTYPTLNTNEEIKNLDTLLVGEQYLILDDLYYTEY